MLEQLSLERGLNRACKLSFSTN